MRERVTQMRTVHILVLFDAMKSVTNSQYGGGGGDEEYSTVSLTSGLTRA